MASQPTTRLTALAGAVLLGLLAAPSAAAPAEQPAAASVADLLRQGNELLEKGRFRHAREAFEEADRLAGGRSADALLGLGTAQFRLGSYEQSAELARRALHVAQKDEERRLAYQMLGLALMAPVTQPADDRLRGAEEAFRKSLAFSQGDSAVSARFFLARTLQKAERGTEALAVAREALAIEAGAKAVRDQARILVCQLRSALGQEAGEAPVSEPAPGPTTAEAAGPLIVGGDVKAPEKILAPPPRYTMDARSDRAEGLVIIQVIIDQEGCVLRPQVLPTRMRPPPELQRAALAAVEKWVFEPAQLDGKPLSVYYNLTVHFQLR